MNKQVITCKQHQSTIEPLITTHQHNPNTCPCCNYHANTRPYDEYDMFLSTYGNQLNRKSLSAIDFYITKERTEYASLQTTIQKLVSKLSLTPSPSPTGYAPLTVVCNDCHSVWRFHRTTINTNQTPPVYCTYCGSANIVVNQDPDLNYMEVIARAYNVPPSVIKLMLDQFQHQNKYTHFNDYVDALRQQLKASIGATN